MIKFAKFSLIFLLLAGNILAQVGGSVYSRYGVGYIENTHSGRRLGMGGLGIAVADADYINFLNPAGWHKLQQTRVELGFTYDGIKLDDGTEQANYSDASFSGLTLGFPIDRDYGIAFSLGLVPVTNVSYNVIGTESYNLNVELEDEYKVDYSGKGGLSQVYMGISYKTPFDFIIGASYEYFVGKIEYITALTFVDSDIFTDVEYVSTKSYYGPGATFGLISNDFSQLFGWENIKDFRFGLIYTIYSDLNTDTTLASTSIAGLIEHEDGTVKSKIPARFGAGVSLTWNKNYLFLLDYLYQPWSKYRFNGQPDLNLKNQHRVSLGFEYKNVDRRSKDGFWEQFDLRGGLSFEDSQYEVFGENIMQYMVHFGLSFPIGDFNSVDIGLAYGFRGKTESNLIKEDIFRGTVSISLGEMWFVRQER
jgi:hypothetical protein